MMGLYSLNSLSNFTNRELRMIAKECKKYCEENISKKTNVTFRVVKSRRKDDAMGDYCPYDKTINLYHDKIKNIGEFTSTFIHEYTHSLQPIKSKYYKLLKKHGYDKHPHEIESRRNEKLHNRKLLNYLRRNNTI
jgi:hypothetical protein